MMFDLSALYATTGEQLALAVVVVMIVCTGAAVLWAMANGALEEGEEDE